MILISLIAAFCVGAVFGFFVGMLLAVLLVVSAEKEE